MGSVGAPGREETAIHLKCRVDQEIEAAINAGSARATIIHVILATAYAQQLQACRMGNNGSAS